MNCSHRPQRRLRLLGPGLLVLAVATTVCSSTILGQKPAPPGRFVQPREPDFIPSAIGFTADRLVQFTLVNNGLTAVTTPFVVDIYVDGHRADTYKVKALGAQAATTIVSPLAASSRCAATSVRVVADAQGVVSEHSETNNDVTVSRIPPCPDLVVSEIKREWQDNNTRYRIRFTVKNRGNTAVPVLSTIHVGGSGGAPGSLPFDYDLALDPLPPGGTKTFHHSQRFLATTSAYIRLILDFNQQVAESDEANDFRERFNPL